MESGRNLSRQLISEAKNNAKAKARASARKRRCKSLIDGEALTLLTKQDW